MNRYLPFILIVLTVGFLTSSGFAQPEDPTLYAGEGSCLGVVESFGLPVRLETDHGVLTPSSSEQVDRTFILLRKALQGRSCALKFSDIFSPTESSPYFPLTNYLIASVSRGNLPRPPPAQPGWTTDRPARQAGLDRRRTGNRPVRDRPAFLLLQLSDRSRRRDDIGQPPAAGRLPPRMERPRRPMGPGYLFQRPVTAPGRPVVPLMRDRTLATGSRNSARFFT